MEVIHNLLNYKNLKIFQNSEWFNFSLDSVLVAHFVNISKSKIILDFCTGNAPIPMMLYNKTDAKIIGIELQKEICDLALKSININKMNDRISIINKDIRTLNKVFENESIDTIICNPPFFKYKADSRINANEIKTIARHEIYMNLEDIFIQARTLLKNGGNIAIVHRTERLADIITYMRKNCIEPKKLRFVFPKEKTQSNIVLIEGIKNANSGIKVLPPLYAHNIDGSYTLEVKKMFE